MKRLLITASTFPRWKGDTEPRFVLDYAKGMKKYFDVTVLAPMCPGAKRRETLEGVKVIRYHYFPIYKWETLCYPGAIVPRIKEKKVRAMLVPFLLFGLWFKLLQVLKDYDIVHAHWLIPQGIIQSYFRKPYIVTGHGGDVTSLNSGIMRNLKKRCLEHASAVTVVSQALKNCVCDIADIESKCDIIPMGCDVRAFSSRNRVENYFQQGENKVVLFVGRLAEKKGVAYLIEAMSNIDALLVIVGQGPLENELREQAAVFGDKIKFLGPKTHQELPQIYASADIACVPSVTAGDGDKEGFGLVILEAMASGLPVVASRSGGIPDIIRDGYNGLLCEEKNVVQLAENINRLLVDAGLRSDIIAKNSETVQQYAYESIAERYNAIIEKT